MDLEKILPKDGPPINEVTKYIEKYKNDLIVIKYGGNVLIDRNVFNNFITDLSVLNKLGIATVVISTLSCPLGASSDILLLGSYSMWLVLLLPWALVHMVGI